MNSLLVSPERVSALIYNRDIPRSDNERVLVKAYYYALDGRSLLSAYLEHSDLPIEQLHCFIAGYSAGLKVRNFMNSQAYLENRIQ